MASINNQGASSSSASLQVQHSRTYDVFLSFRGDDTRFGFTGNLYNALDKKGIKTFIDIDLPRGEEISRTLPKAIQESRIFIIIFSENYASSKWCLDELVEILHCRESKQQKVVPIFYKMEPSDIGHHRGSFGKALADHKIKFKDNEEKVRGWTRALQQASKLSGWPFKEGEYEFEFINKIVEWISVQLLNYTNLEVAKYPVGIESRLQDMNKLLGVGENDRRIVGIWGTPGIGKTTIAKAVFNLIGHKFEGRCILENVGEKSKSHEGIAQLQGTLLYEILGDPNLKEINFNRGFTVIKERLSHKRLLLILDDVNELDWLRDLAHHTGLFGEGSRIIITTKNKSLLIHHGIKKIYEVKKLDEQQALELFSWHAFERNEPPEGFVELAQCAIWNAECLPLALKLLGSHLRYAEGKDCWEATLDTYKIAPSSIQNTLRISYESLTDIEREVFLDIACFFNGEEKDYLRKILEDDDLDFHGDYFEALIQNAIITLDENNRISMHSLLEQMGKDIVRQESPRKQERSRLWFHKDVCNVLMKNKGTDKIKGIKLKLPEPDKIRLNAKSLSGMTNLRYFINCNARLSGCVDYLPNSLKLIDWYICELKYFPANFHPKELVVLNMPNSRITHLGKRFELYTKLNSLNFRGCNFLTKIPDLSGMRNMEELRLPFCTSLEEVDSSVGFLERLVTLDLEGCSNLRMFPTRVCSKFLKQFSLRSCKSLESFPEIVDKMEFLSCLDLKYSGIKELPSSIGNVTGLEILYAEGCENLTNLPPSIYELQHLWYLNLSGCPKLVGDPNYKLKSEVSGLPINSNIPHGNFGLLALPKLYELNFSGCNLSDFDFLENLDCFSTLKILDLSGNSCAVSLPVCIVKFVNLWKLDLNYCKRLRVIPELPPSIRQISVVDCTSLETFSSLSKILEHNDTQHIARMDLSNCHRLCDKLGLDVEKMANRLLNQEEKSCFEVVFPGNEVPKWFNCRQDESSDDESCEEELGICEVVMEIPHNFKYWEDTGLALCVVFKDYNRIGSIVYNFTINGHIVLLGDAHFSDSVGEEWTPQVWLKYIPSVDFKFDEQIDIETETETSSGPYVGRVTFRTSPGWETGSGWLFESCGVHLAGKPHDGNEDDNKDDGDADHHHQEDEDGDHQNDDHGDEQEQPCLKKQRTSYFESFYSLLLLLLGFICVLDFQ